MDKAYFRHRPWPGCVVVRLEQSRLALYDMARVLNSSAASYAGSSQTAWRVFHPSAASVTRHTLKILTSLPRSRSSISSNSCMASIMLFSVIPFFLPGPTRRQKQSERPETRANYQNSRFTAQKLHPSTSSGKALTPSAGDTRPAKLTIPT